jgi:zinc protease
MKMRKQIIATCMNVGLVFLFGMTARAQTSAAAPKTDAASAAPVVAALPTAQEIVARYATMAGGEAAWAKIHSRVSKGTIELEGMNVTGTFEAFEEAPNKSWIQVSLQGVGDFLQACDGTSAWSNDPQNGFRELAGEELEDARREANFYLPIHMADAYSRFAVKAKDKIADRDVYLVDATPASGSKQTMAFDVQTGLLVHRSGLQQTPEGKLPVEVAMEDYKEVDGIKVPYTIRQFSPASFVIRVVEMNQNVAIDEKKFVKPAPVPAAEGAKP